MDTINSLISGSNGELPILLLVVVSVRLLILR
jgi:hypothetical protein